MNHGAPLPTSEINPAISGSWRLDRQRSRVEFRTRTLWGLVSVRGHFEAFEGWLDLGANPAIELVIDASSLQTGNRKRDDHLRSADFFDCEHNPQVRFASESVEPQGQGDALLVRGRLCARGSSIPLALRAHVHPSGEALEIDATVTAPHRQLGMTWNWLGSIRPSSTLRVHAHLERDS